MDHDCACNEGKEPSIPSPRLIVMLIVCTRRLLVQFTPIRLHVRAQALPNKRIKPRSWHSAFSLSPKAVATAL